VRAIGFPLIYRQGQNLIEQLGEYCRVFGKKGFVVSDSFIRETYGEKLSSSLKKKEIETVFARFSGETFPDELSRLSEECIYHSCDFVVGFGGGKSQDAAKVVKKATGVPVVIIPTIASNDAATSRLAITYSKEGDFLGPVFLDTNPDAVFVDTNIILNAPVRFFIAGIGDALATFFEADQCRLSGVSNFFGGKPTETAYAIAEKCYEIIRNEAEKAVDSLKKRELNGALEKVIEANVLLSGLGFEGCGVAAAHAISQGFTLIQELKGNLHGEEVGVALLSQFVLEGRSEEFILNMFDFYSRIGLPSSLRALGLSDPSEDDMATIAGFACRENSRIYNMNIKVDSGSVIQALNKIEELSRKIAN